MKLLLNESSTYMKMFKYKAKNKKEYDVEFDLEAYVDNVDHKYSNELTDLTGLIIFDEFGLEVNADNNNRIVAEIKNHIDNNLFSEEEGE